MGLMRARPSTATNMSRPRCLAKGRTPRRGPGQVGLAGKTAGLEQPSSAAESNRGILVANGVDYLDGP
jgi:hypothetical protein